MNGKTILIVFKPHSYKLPEKPFFKIQNELKKIGFETKIGKSVITAKNPNASFQIFKNGKLGLVYAKNEKELAIMTNFIETTLKKIMEAIE